MCDCIEVMGGKVDMPLDTVALVDKLRAEAYWCDASMENSDFPFAVRTAFKLLAELHRKVAEKLCSQATRLQSLERELERTNARYEALLANFKGRCLYCTSCDHIQDCMANLGCLNVPIACGMSKLEPARRTSGDERG